MFTQIEIVLFWLIFADSLVANFLAWFGQDWYIKHFQTFSRIFPATKGWAVYYLVLVLWIGSFIYR